MGSITNDPNGLKRYQFVAGDGSRKAVRLGRASAKQANAFKVKADSLVSALITGVMDDEVSRWLMTLDDVIYDRMAAVGLVEPRGAIKLDAFLGEYIDGRHDVKPATKTVLGHTRRNLVEFFGAERLIRTVTRGDADNWRLHLIAQKLEENTIRRRCGIAKQFFRAACRLNVISANPFSDLKAAVMANRSREFFITRGMTTRVIDKCPDAEWRAIVALSRYGGLRCPSEHLALTWNDVHWGEKRITIHSPKTEHHPNGELRVIPLFPELEPYLEQLFEQVPAGGSPHVISSYRSATKNFRTRFEKIIRRAGLTPWPKLFQNLRSTRETELAEKWPLHVVCAWMGNSQAVAKKHYLQVTDEHFAAAVADGKEGGEGGEAGEAAHIQAHAASAQERTHAHTERESGEYVDMQEGALVCASQLGDEGLEQSGPAPGNYGEKSGGGAESGAPKDGGGGGARRDSNSLIPQGDSGPKSQPDAHSDARDPELAELLRVWPTLSIDHRREIYRFALKRITEGKGAGA